MPSALFISSSLDASSTRYRAVAFFPRLEQAGWKVAHASSRGGPLRKCSILAQARRADAVIVLRRMFNAAFRHLLRRSAHRLVFDFDDSIFAHSNGAPSLSRQRRFQDMIRFSDRVWAGNAYLAERAHAAGATHVIVLPTVIDPARYDVNPSKPDDRIDMVWIGSTSTRKYLEGAMPMLTEASRREPRLRLKIIADFDLPQSGIRSLAVPWSSAAEATALAASHIGIAPMPDDQWAQGKCALKVIQYMAAGLPVVSSAAGVNRCVVEHGVTGFLASDQQTWLATILKLANDRVLRDQMGQAGRRRVQDVYSLDAVYPSMLSELAMTTTPARRGVR